MSQQPAYCVQPHDILAPVRWKIVDRAGRTAGIAQNRRVAQDVCRDLNDDAGAGDADCLASPCAVRETCAHPCPTRTTLPSETPHA